MRALAAGTIVVVALLVSGCADAPALMAKGADPEESHEDRVVALHDALQQRDPGVAQDLSARAEYFLETQGTRERVAKDRACALDIVDALVRAADKSAQVLSLRLADHESAYLRSRPALERLARHTDPTVRDLARAQLARLPR